MPKISAFIICCNEEEHLRRCLESVRWCDEIVVVDSGSTDGTLAICEELQARIIHHSWEGFVKQKSFALSQCQYEWVFNIDADEEVSEPLKQEILDLMGSSAPCNGYEISRVVYFLGRWWRKGGWYPEYRLRLCRKEFTRWGGQDPHERAEVTGQIGRLQGELFHYTYKDFSDQVTSLNAHSSVAARSLYSRGKKAYLHDLALRPIARFIKFYFLRGGYREGLAGLLVGVMEWFYVFLKYLKLRELQSRGRTYFREQV